jgi:hypothetical protein
VDVAPPAEPQESTSPILPLVFVEVGGKTVPTGSKIPCTVKVIGDHDGSQRNLSARPATLESACGFGVRGATSVKHAKKSFGLELRDAAGADRALPLAGMPAESDWVLHSCYADKSCLRNALAYALGRALGRWAPRTRFVELFIDGKLHGLYVAIEKIKRDRNRVALPRVTADDLSGGYIVKAEAGGEGMPGENPARDGVSPVEPRVWSYHQPRYDEITAAQRQYTRDHLTKLETLARTARFTDPKEGYPAYGDPRIPRPHVPTSTTTRKLDICSVPYVCSVSGGAQDPWPS